MQPIVVVEGGDENASSRVVPDRKMYRAIYEKFDRVTLICGGGKGECIKLRQRLQEALGYFSKTLTVRALLDRDVSDKSPDEETHLLPVSMIENFLLDPEAIWETIQSVVERTEFKSVEDVAAALDAIVDAREPVEVERRVLRSFGSVVFPRQTPLDNLAGQVSVFSEALQKKFAADKIKESLDQAMETVDGIRHENKRREYFDGKAILEQFFKKHLHKSGLGKVVFLFECGRHARRRKSVAEFFNTFFSALMPVEDGVTKAM